MRRFLLVFTIVLAASAAQTLTPSSAHADTAAKIVKVRPSSAVIDCPSGCNAFSKGNDAQMRVNVPTKLTAATAVAVTVNFGSDQVGAGEEIWLTIGTTSVGWFNLGSSVASRSFTLEQNFQDAAIASFLDGHQTLQIWMSTGSATIASVTVTIS